MAPAAHFADPAGPPAEEPTTAAAGQLQETIQAQQEAQQRWAAAPVRQRLATLRRIRHALAGHTEELTRAISVDLSRNRADTLAAEILPTLVACRFLECETARLLAPRRLGRRGLPFWLAGIDVTVERVPLGVILIVAPSNYPLFLPAVQALQALAAGNAVVWKPGRGGLGIARLFAMICEEAGLPSRLLRVTDEAVATCVQEIAAQPAKIVFTGSACAGRAIQHLAAERSIPVVAELSGCDAVIALPSANHQRLVDALCFGMRLNGSATCMAPRRLILAGEHPSWFLATLEERFAAMDPVFIPEPVRLQLRQLLADAALQGAQAVGHIDDLSMKPMLLRNGVPAMQICQADVFAPVLTVLHAADTDQALAIEAASPFGLTASIFGAEREALALVPKLQVGTVLVNDLIVPTADPRISFGGRRESGFGATRGREGLLEMTAVRTTSLRRGDDRKPFQPTGPNHEELFTGVALMNHAGSWRARLSGLMRMIEAARKF